MITRTVQHWQATIVPRVPLTGFDRTEAATWLETYAANRRQMGATAEAVVKLLQIARWLRDS